MAIETYQHSGAIGSKTWPGLAVAVVVSAGPIALAYQYAVDWAPYDALAVFLVIIMGFALGAVAGKALAWGECRNALLGPLLVLVVALAGLAGSYGVAFQKYLGLFEAETGRSRFELMSKESFLRFLDARAASGWTVGHSTYTGWEVYGIWIAEAALVIGCAWAGAAERLRTPYCEGCQQWTKSGPKLVKPNVSAEEVKAALAQGSLSGLLGPQRRPEATRAWMEYGVYQCPSCDRSDFVTVTLATGNPNVSKQQNRKVLVRNALVTRAEAQALT